jgi:hypothetical protein
LEKSAETVTNKQLLLVIISILYFSCGLAAAPLCSRSRRMRRSRPRHRDLAPPLTHASILGYRCSSRCGTRMDSFADKNRSVFEKLIKSVRFYWLTENRLIGFENFKNLENIEIKNPKKTRLYFKNSSQNRIQKFIFFHAGKIAADFAGV